MGKSSSKDKLIEAMASLILEKGLANTSPRDILERSGVGHGSLYHHFKGKEDLALHSVNHNIDTWKEKTKTLFSANQGPKEKLNTYFDSPRDVMRGCLIGQMARDGEMMASPELAEAITGGFSWITEKLESVLQEGIQSGDFNAWLSPSETALLILCSVQGSYVVAKGLQDEAVMRKNINALKKLIFSE